MQLQQGRRLGTYTVTATLGAGGMGEVYKARDSVLDRTVALKVLQDEADAGQGRLLREARSAAVLSHPNICVVHEIGEHQGYRFIVMEYVEGPSLAELIAGGPLSVGESVRYAGQIADALTHAHGHGVVHRDLKAANVIITPDGRAKVLDFGLATRIPSAAADASTAWPAVSAESRVAGTLAYMAPELLHAMPADVPSDIWALGVLTYEMATGALPFRGASAFALTAAILRDDVAFPSGWDHPALGRIIRRCLEKAPADRFAAAREVRVALESLDAGGPAVAAPEAAVARAVSAPSIAVLPFANLTGDATQDYFCDGMAEDIIGALGRLDGLHVASRTSAFRFRGRASAIEDIRRQLQVSTILEGSVRRSGHRLRINVNLVDVTDGFHLWSDKYDREIEDLFAVQDDISRAVVDTLRIKLVRPSKARFVDSSTDNIAAYNLYLQGRYQLNKRTPEGLRHAVEFFEQAIIADGSYAHAYAGLADTYCLLAFHGSFPPRAVWPKAKRAAEQAIALNESVGAAHASLGFVTAAYDWDFAAAERSFRRALTLNPNDANAHHWYGINVQSPTGRLDEALASLQRAVVLDPLSPSINTSLGGVLHDRRDFRGAVEHFRKTVDLAPEFYFGYWSLGRSYEQLGMYEQAIAAQEKARTLAPTSPSPLAYLVRSHALSGNRAEARRLMDELLARRESQYIDHLVIALARFGLDELDEGFASLDAAVEDRSVWLIWTKVAPIYDPVRDDPRYAALLAKIGLPV